MTIGDVGGERELELPKGAIQVGLIVRLATSRDLGTVAAESLASSCYEDPLPHNWRDGISQSASRLRKLGVPISKGGSYQLLGSPDAVDVLRFERLAKAAIAKLNAGDASGLDQMTAAHDLWLNSPLEVFGDYRLVVGSLERFEKLNHRLYLAGGRHLLQSKDGDPVSLLEQALAEFPESSDLAALHEAASGRPTPIPDRERQRGVQHNLPGRDSRGLIGRDDELKRVHEILRPYPHSQYPTITIDGVGGVGKTALAVETAYNYVENEPSEPEEAFTAVVWASAKRTVLADRVIEQTPTFRNISDLYSAIATTLDRSDVLAADADDHGRIIRELLSQQGTRVLLVVDNLETVDDERVLHFLRDLPAPTKAVITTRHRVEGAVPLRLEGLDPEFATDLAGDAAGFHGIALEPKTAEAISRDTGGIPLAILWSVAQIAKRGDPERVLLRLRSATGEYAQFCFQESVALLAERNQESARSLLYAVSLFSDPATREAVGAVAGMNERPGERDDALEVLTDLALVNFADGRFSLLPLTREFVSSDIGRDLSLRDASLGRWLDWTMELTAQAAAGGTDLNSGILDHLREEQSNVNWAIEYALRNGRSEAFVPLVRSMEFFWLGEGLWSEFERYLDMARTLATSPEDKVHFANRLLWLYVLREDFGAAQAMRGNVELVLGRFEIPYEQMRYHDFVGQLELALNRPNESTSHFQDSLSIAETLEDRRGLFACTKYLGEVECLKGDSTKAREHLEEASKYTGDPSDRQWLRGLAHSSQLEGAIAELEQRWDIAEAAYIECVRLLGFHPDAHLETVAREGLARALAEQGDVDGSRLELETSAAVLEKLGMWTRSSRLRAQINDLNGGDDGE